MNSGFKMAKFPPYSLFSFSVFVIFRGLYRRSLLYLESTSLIFELSWASWIAKIVKWLTCLPSDGWEVAKQSLKCGYHTQLSRNYSQVELWLYPEEDRGAIL